VDHGSKATLPLTIPCRIFKLSAKDSTLRLVGIVLEGGPRGSFTAKAWPSARQASNKPNAKDLEGTSNRPRGEMTGTIMRGVVCPSSEDGGQASAAGTSRHEVRDSEESQRMGAHTKI
jgi:hypothetical protein